LRLTGYGAFRTKRNRPNVPNSTIGLEEIDECRLFFRVPGGLLTEVTFAETLLIKFENFTL
jgi:hypothetical protein